MRRYPQRCADNIKAYCWDPAPATWPPCSSPADLLTLYRTNNGPRQSQLIFVGDLGAALNEPSPRHCGRTYLGNWERRDLRMASDLRDVPGLTPGRKILVAVGASHKAYLKAYLHQIHDVQPVDAVPLL